MDENEKSNESSESKAPACAFEAQDERLEIETSPSVELPKDASAESASDDRPVFRMPTEYALPGAPTGPQQPNAAFSAASAPQKKTVWPWIVAGCLIAALLGFGGCVGCTACTACSVLSLFQGSPVGVVKDLGNIGDEGGSTDPSGRSDAMESYSLEDLRSFAESYGLTNREMNGHYGSGLYVAGQDMEPGLYFLGGSQQVEGSYYLFKESKGGYVLDASVIYFGNYFVNLQKGDVIMFLTEDATMYAVGDMVFEGEKPYASGLYRVGTDIPAGTYTVSAQKGAAKIERSDEPAAYVMKDLEFDEDSVTQEIPLSGNAPRTVTVEDGDYLELYLASAL